jgi:hypothetical protein
VSGLKLKEIVVGKCYVRMPTSLEKERSIEK